MRQNNVIIASKQSYFIFLLVYKHQYTYKIKALKPIKFFIKVLNITLKTEFYGL